jgi:signal transduction histidine kinase
VIGRFVFGVAAGATAALLVQGHGRRSNGVSQEPHLNGESLPQLDSDGDARKLVGIIAHELRTPTSVILGYQELLAGGLLGPVNERTLEALERIRRAAGQLRDLTDGLQILTDDVPDRNPPEEFLTDLVAAAIRSIEAAVPDAESSGIRLDLLADPDIWVRADPDSVERILDLVIAAALRAAPSHTLQLALCRQTHFVSLQARGVSFDPDRYAPALRTPPDQIGSGLALRLAIAQRIATSLRGSLSLSDTGLLSLQLPAAAR